MFRPRLENAPKEKPIVFSWLAHAEWQQSQRPRSSFEVLVRHLFDRLLSGVSLHANDETTISRSVQAAYIAALPTMLFALYLFPAYHYPLGKPDFWAQARHHLFYVDCSFALMGLVTVLLWDLLFPDTIDVLILTQLPIAARKLLLARILAIAILLGGILLGTSSLGILFFPAVADLRHIGLQHFAVHAAAVLTAGLCAIFSVIALQGIVVCCLSQRLAQAILPPIQAVCAVFFTMLLILEPLLAHLLQPTLTGPASSLRWLPPFWFLGLYEHLLWKRNAAPVFGALARTGLLSTAGMMLLAFATYPVAYMRRARQAIEGGRPAHRPAASSLLVARLVNGVLLHDGRRRAIFYWISQTLLRTQRTRLLLALVAAFVLAAPVATWMLSLQPASPENAALLLQVARLAIPAAAFFTVAGLRTALRSPVAQSGAWLFRVVFGRPKPAHRIGAEIWVSGCACVVTTLIAIIVQCFEPCNSFDVREFVRQAAIGIILALLLTGILFLREFAIPFTELRASSVNDLSITVVSCFVLFPVGALALVNFEPWLANARLHYLILVIVTALVYAGLRVLAASSYRNALQAVDMEEDPLLPGEIGLRN